MAYIPIAKARGFTPHLVNVENWNSDVSAALRITDYVARTSLAIFLVIGMILRQISKKHKTDDKIKELKNEIEQIKRNKD